MSDRDFDGGIIGAGLGGLECAVMLARERMSVCVLEKNQQLGGSLQVFSRDKTVFDTGVHYIGGLCPGQNLHRYFSYLGIMDKLKLRRMDMEGFDHISLAGDPIEYPHAQGWTRFAERLVEFFPQERSAITRYCNEVRTVCRRFPLYNLEYSEEQEWRNESLSVNAEQFIASLTSNTTLRNVLGGSNALYAGEGKYSPFYVHALVVNTYIESSWRCVDGGSQIAKHLAHNARAAGATIHARKHVTGLDMGPEGVSAVRTADGDSFTCKHMIANIHPRVLLEMIGPGHVRPAYRSRINALENTISSFTAHLVMKPGAFPYMDHNIYHTDIDNVWDAVERVDENWPNSWMLSTPRTSHTTDHADAVTVMAYMRYGEVAQWADTHNSLVSPGERGGDYDAFKRVKVRQLVEAVDRHFPGIASGVRAVHSSSPLTFRDYIGSWEGTMYGIRKDSADAIRTFIPPRTKVPNLLLTGQNINLHGLLGVTVSSVVTCGELLGRRYLLEKIRANA